MSYLNPHIQICDTTSQAIASANTPQVVTFNTDTFKRKIAHSSVTNPSRITVPEDGDYLIIISAQIDLTGANNKTLDMWLRIDGSDVTNSNVKTTIVNTTEQKQLSLNFAVTLSAGQYVEAVISGDDTGLSLKAYAAGSTPTRPVTPSIMLSMEKLS